MNTNKFTKFLLILVAILLITIPICAIFDLTTQADSTKESITSYDNDYVFFVVEDNKTPLAAAPVIASHSISPVVWVVSLTFIFVLFICYASWYLMLKHNTITFVNKLPSYLRNRRNYKGNFLHPIRAFEESTDMVYDVAKSYFKD